MSAGIIEAARVWLHIGRLSTASLRRLLAQHWVAYTLDESDRQLRQLVHDSYIRDRISAQAILDMEAT